MRLTAVASITANIGDTYQCEPIEAPDYNFRNGDKFLLGVHSMSRHMTDEGWLLQKGLEYGGYIPFGHGYKNSETDVREILKGNPSVVFVQDKREWDRDSGACFEKEAHFEYSCALAERNDIFKVTVVKDAQNSPEYHQDAAKEIGCHAWVCYYHPTVVCELAKYIRPQHLIRTYHCINPIDIPEFTKDRPIDCLVSGAVYKDVYPLRSRLWNDASSLPGTMFLSHPRYGVNGSCTPQYLKILGLTKVAVCTSSIYSYALRKIIEATACGCMVITDLHESDELPEIDGNLTRIRSNYTTGTIRRTIRRAINNWNDERQREFASKARFYDYRNIYWTLCQDIEDMRVSYRAA